MVVRVLVGEAAEGVGVLSRDDTRPPVVCAYLLIQQGSVLINGGELLLKSARVVAVHGLCSSVEGWVR